MILASIISALVPILIFFFFLWKLDKNRSEPIFFVLLHFLYGATVAIILGLFFSKLFSLPIDYLFIPEESNYIKVILIAPIFEEISKAALLFKTIKSKNVDNLTDGFVYGGAIGLGFGMTENFLYFIAFGTTIEVLIPLVIMRTLFSAVMHSISTATVGGIMSLSKYSSKKRFRISTIIGLTIAMLIHSIWNFNIDFIESLYSGIDFL